MKLKDYLYDKNIIKTMAEFKRICYLGLVSVNDKFIKLDNLDIDIDPEVDEVKLYEEFQC